MHRWLPRTQLAVRPTTLSTPVFFDPRRAAYLIICQIGRQALLTTHPARPSVTVTSTHWASFRCAQQQAHLPSAELPDDRSYSAATDHGLSHIIIKTRCCLNMRESQISLAGA